MYKPDLSGQGMGQFNPYLCSASRKGARINCNKDSFETHLRLTLPN